MEMTIGELADRYTIELRKNLFGAQNSEMVREIIRSIAIFADSHTKYPGIAWSNIAAAIAHLAIINDSIATLEWQIRANENLDLQEIGTRAKAIRKLNDKRVVYKNLLCSKFGQPEGAVYFGIGDLKPDELTLGVQEVPEET